MLMFSFPPSPTGSTGVGKFLATVDQETLNELYAGELNSLQKTVDELKARRCYYAKEADEYLQHMKMMIREYSLSKKLHKNFHGILGTTKELFFTPVVINNEINPAFTACAAKLDNQMQKLQSHKNGQIFTGVGFCLIAAMAIGAMIAICVTNPVVLTLIFIPIIFCLAAAKPAILGGFSFNNAYKAHGLLSKLTPLVDKVNERLVRHRVEPLAVEHSFYTVAINQ